MDPSPTNRFRNLASTVIILILLLGVLAFYYFKYVPERQKEFNRNGFLELSQIQTALQTRSTGYWDAFKNIIQNGKLAPDMLREFNYKPEPEQHLDPGDDIHPSYFDRDPITRQWKMVYDVYENPAENKDQKVCTLSKDVDALLSPLVFTYQELFDGYLLMCRDRIRLISNNPGDGKQNAKDSIRLRANIIYCSNDLSTDYLVNADSLLNKNDGFSTLNIVDVIIAGNPYKLFLYPFEMGRQRLILTGFISESNYREANQKIPFSIFTALSVLLLLLIIHLPILRMYVLGSNERIRALDIRLIIGSYFIAAFFGFFLFTKIFLDKEQSIQNKIHLETLANKITDSFSNELGFISSQLQSFDTAFENLCNEAKDPTKESKWFLKSMISPDMEPEDIDTLDKLLKANVYPYAVNVFWINDTGQWVSRWALKYSQTKSEMISVKDRTYFTDFRAGKISSIPLKHLKQDSLTIQPTLSKLEGEYIITVVKRSKVPAFKLDEDSFKPYLIGLSSKMYSVSGVIMPPGYGFSMIDGDGNILFDSKEGRPLLSNILKETEDPGGIQQSARYRNKRYFDGLLLRNKNMALLSTPVKGTPYQLLVYYNRFRSDAFEEHLIALSAGLIGIIICLVLFCGLINQWAKSKNRMLESRASHFEWLYPSGDLLKLKYYRHLIVWMLWLLMTYLMAWFIMDAQLAGTEFSMLFISLLFPFYIAIHYFELRGTYYDQSKHYKDIYWYFSRPSLALRVSLWFFIIAINCFVPFYKVSGSIALPVLITQLCWLSIIAVSLWWFRKYSHEKGSKSNSADVNQDLNENQQAPKQSDVSISKPDPKKNPDTIHQKIPGSYIWAILIGVALISVIPASGIFWLFFREETGLYQNADQLITVKRIDQRRDEINAYLKDYKFKDSSKWSQSKISELKFNHGIYTLSGQSFSNDAVKYNPLNHYPSADYTHLHEMLISSDSIAWAAPSDHAEDSSWYFGKEDVKSNPDPALLFLNMKDGVNPTSFRLTADSTTLWSTAGLLTHSFSGDGPMFPISFLVGLIVSLIIAYFLTVSLSKRIFLVELELVSRQSITKENMAAKIYEKSNISNDVKLIMSSALQQLPAKIRDEKLKEYGEGLPDLQKIYQFEKSLPMSLLEATIPSLVNTLEPVYMRLWTPLSNQQKFILYDFAQDGFANYKAGKDLQQLTEKGLLFFDDLRLSMMTLSFQEYVLQQKDDEGLTAFLAKTGKEGTWKKLHTPLFILITAAGIFIFVTQDAIYQKITGLITSLTSLLPLLSNLFNKSGGGGKPGDA
jgi:hypothetical protein